MKARVQFLFLTFLVITILTSCTKDKINVPRSSVITPPAPATPITPSGPIIHGSRDYFWGHPWQKTSRGFEIHLNTTRLTEEAINKGFSVSVAIWTEMTTFEMIPLTFYEHTQKDSVQLSYSARAGQLQVIAKASFEIKYQSDVYIEYY